MSPISHPSLFILDRKYILNVPESFVLLFVDLPLSNISDKLRSTSSHCHKRDDDVKRSRNTCSLICITSHHAAAAVVRLFNAMFFTLLLFAIPLHILVLYDLRTNAPS